MNNANRNFQIRNEKVKACEENERRNAGLKVLNFKSWQFFAIVSKMFFLCLTLKKHLMDVKNDICFSHFLKMCFKE